MKFTVESENREKCGIYMIRNSVDERVYIGQAVNFYKRFLGHRALLVSGNHPNDLLKDFVKDHSIDCLEFTVLECTGKLGQRERHYIKKYKSICKDHGFNIDRCGISFNEFGSGYTLNTVNQLSTKKKLQYEINCLLLTIEEYREHFENIAASNCALSDAMEDFEYQMWEYEKQYKLKLKECQELRLQYGLLFSQLSQKKAHRLRKKTIATNQLSLSFSAPPAVAPSFEPAKRF